MSAEQIGLFPQGESRGGILISGMWILRKQPVGLKRGHLRYADCTWMDPVWWCFLGGVRMGEAGMAMPVSGCVGIWRGCRSDLFGGEEGGGGFGRTGGVSWRAVVVGLGVTVISHMGQSGVAARQ